MTQTPETPSHGDRHLQQLKLDVRMVRERAEEIVHYVAESLPSHTGLRSMASGVAQAARTAEQVAKQLRRPLGVHRLPAFFLLLSIACFGFWIYWNFLYTSTLTIAVSARDAVQLKLDVGQRVRLIGKQTVGSRESIAMLHSQQADLAFVQGGVELPAGFVSTRLASSELVLLFLRDGLAGPAEIRTMLTSSMGQGSHTIAKLFASAWQLENVQYLHDWRVLTEQDEYEIPAAVDAVLVVKDPMSTRVSKAATRLHRKGFHLASPDIGAFSLRMPFLRETTIREGYLNPAKEIPKTELATYSVFTYLVARPDLTPRQMAAAQKLLDVSDNQLGASAFEPTVGTASEVAQGIEAVLGIMIYIGLAFLAMLGIDIITYRRHFNELNSLVSLLSMHQSARDAIVGSVAVRKHNIAYLRVCSDLLGLISVITGYYTQENPSLLYNRLPEIIHDRCDGLKINIQLKILHGLVHDDSAAADAKQSADGPGCIGPNDTVDA